MLTLNIIPPNLKNEIRLKNIYKILKKLFSILIILISVYAIIILISQFILQIHFIQTIYATTLVTKTVENYSKQIRNIDNQLNSISKIQKDYINWSRLVEYIAKNTKNDIKFYQIKINKKDDAVSFIGFAQTRESLMLLKETFENSKYFNNINFPIKNLLEKNNINFEISAHINSYEFE
jgi:hypothetical protein